MEGSFKCPLCAGDHYERSKVALSKHMFVDHGGWSPNQRFLRLTVSLVARGAIRSTTLRVPLFLVIIGTVLRLLLPRYRIRHLNSRSRLDPHQPRPAILEIRTSY